MAKIQVYSKSYCPYCDRAKQLLRTKGLDFEEVNLDNNDEELRALRERTKFLTVPQIFIGDKMIGGYNELAALNANGDLDRMVQG